MDLHTPWGCLKFALIYEMDCTQMGSPKHQTIRRIRSSNGSAVSRSKHRWGVNIWSPLTHGFHETPPFTHGGVPKLKNTCLLHIHWGMGPAML